MLFFSVIALTLPLLSLSFSFSDIFDGKCDKFEKEERKCLALHRNDIERTYSSWTTLNQARRLTPSNNIRLSHKCKPVMFYLISRHAARYPSLFEISEIEQVLPRIQAELAVSYDRRLDQFCSHDYQAIRVWRPRINRELAGHISPSGFEATKDMAKNLYNRYPNLFNPRSVNFNVGITNKNRTYETANAFIDGIRDMEPQISKKIHFDVRNYLEFNKICLKKIGIKEPQPKELAQITQSELFTKLRRSVSKRLGFRRTISDHELEVMYRACAIEQAIFYNSPWCGAFNKMELEALEIRRDIAEYYKNGPGSQISKRMACPIVSNLYSAVVQAIRNPESRNTHLQFADSAAMSRLWNMFGLFDKIELHKNWCPKSKHSFRTSQILPFNSNFNAVLYRCSNDPDTTNPADYKLLTMVNGKPVEIEKCDDEDCRADRFLLKFKAMARTCDLDDVCPTMERIDDDFDDEE